MTEAVGRVASINLSDGGVPKRPVPRAQILQEGVGGDRQANRKLHGGPDRAVSLFSLERIRALQVEGHPIEPGSVGENLTLAEIDWAALVPGARLRFAGGVELEIASYTLPCKTIRGAFRAGEVERISQKRHAGWSRLYARVLVEGWLEVGEAVVQVAGL